MVRIKVEKVNDIAVEANLSPKNDSFEILLTELQQSKPERKENEERERERERERESTRRAERETMRRGSVWEEHCVSTFGNFGVFIFYGHYWVKE